MTKNYFIELEEHDEPTYLAIVKAIAKAVQSRELSQGDRLATHRELADHLGIAIGTVSRAYNEAEKQGLIYGDGRRGSFVGQYLSQSTLPSFYQDESTLINMGCYYPAVENDPDLLEVLSILSKRRESQGLLRYALPDGFDSHREAGTRWIARLGRQVGPDAVIVTAGGQHAIFIILLALAEPGDVVATENHTYPGIKKVARALRLDLVGISEDSEGIIPDDFRQLCSRKKVRAIYCCPTLQNPTNAILSQSRRQEIAEIAEKYDVLVIEDEVNRPLVPDPPELISNFIPDQSILVASISKVLAAGLRVGFLATPLKYKPVLTKMVKTTSLMVSTLPTEIVTYWLKSGIAEKVIKERIQEQQLRQKIAAEFLGGFSYKSHPTSYFIWLQVPQNYTSEGFAIELHRRGVAVTPSDSFVIDEKRKANAIRICIGAGLDIATLKKSLGIISDVLKGAEDTDSSIV